MCRPCIIPHTPKQENTKEFLCPPKDCKLTKLMDALKGEAAPTTRLHCSMLWAKGRDWCRELDIVLVFCLDACELAHRFFELQSAVKYVV